MPRGANYKKTRQYGGGFAANVNLRKQKASVRADVAYLSTLINSELHTFALNDMGANIDSTGTVTSLNDFVNGDDNANRTGNSTLVRFMNMNLVIKKSSTGPSFETIRVIIFRYWGESTSSAPSLLVSEILDASGQPQAFLNLDNTGKRGDRDRRIEIHKSKLICLDTLA